MSAVSSLHKPSDKTEGARRVKGTAAPADVIERLFAPRSVAVVGASADMRKWGGMAAEQVSRDRDLRRVHFVNARGGEILGDCSATSYRELDEVPDLAVITVPQQHFESTVSEVLEKGTRAIVAITAGFSEEGPEGMAIEDRVAARVRAAGAALLGPNCMGIFDGHAPFRCMPWAELNPGEVGLVSQSGGYIMDIADQLEAGGRGLSRVASVGNESDLAIPDLLDNLATHEPTRLVLAYCEDFSACDRLFDSIARTVAAGKEVVLMTPRSGPAARRAARLHTGSRMIDIAAVRRRAAAAGAHHAFSPRQGVDLALALLSPGRSAGRRVAVLSDTGGPAVLCAGLCEEGGLDLPLFSNGLKSRLGAALSPRATVDNPVDLVDNLDVDAAVVALQILLDAGDADAVLLNIHAFVHDTPEKERRAAQRIVELAQRSGKPVVLTSRAFGSTGIKTLIELGLPVYRDAESAVRGLAALCGRTAR